MSLHPIMDKFLKSLPVMPEGYTPTVTDFRSRKTNYPPEAVTPVNRVEDREIPGLAGNIPIRMYNPEGDGPFPLLMFFHGGGFVSGSIERHDPLCRNIVQASGYKVISVEYRLAPEHPFPAAPEDCYIATTWVHEHAEELNGDKSRLAVAGDSAGGTLATVVSLMARDRRGPMISKQVLLYPVTDYYHHASCPYPSYKENEQGYFLTSKSMEVFWNLYLSQVEDKDNPYASPIRSTDLSRLPPALVLTAEYDPLRDEGEQYADRLREAGVPVEGKRYEGLIHGFFNIFSLTADQHQIKEIYDLIGTFLNDKR